MNVSSDVARSFRTNYNRSNTYSQSQGSRPRQHCDYCKKLGHVRAKCYKLIGYPPRDKEKGNGFYQGQQQPGSNYARQGYNRGKGVVAAAAAHNSTGDIVAAAVEGVEGTKEQGMFLSKEQYSQLLGMMQQYQDQNANTSAAAINFAGPFNEETSGDW